MSLEDWLIGDSPIGRLLRLILKLPNSLGFVLFFILLIPATYVSFIMYPFVLLKRRLR